jgi:hypothetical protein
VSQRQRSEGQVGSPGPAPYPAALFARVDIKKENRQRRFIFLLPKTKMHSRFNLWLKTISQQGKNNWQFSVAMGSSELIRIGFLWLWRL